MNKQILETIAQSIVKPGKGILAADESLPTIKKRFAAIDVASTEESRRSYRELLFTTPKVQEFISGVILFDETIRQSTGNSHPFVQVLSEKGIHPGIKVDRGAKELAGSQGEKITEGLDGLRERLAEYRDLGAQFAKWRAVIVIDPHRPSRFAVESNAAALGRYAALCQEAGLVPIVEPEVLMDGEHDMQRCREVTAFTLQTVYAALFENRVHLEGTLLKPNMVLPGKDCPDQALPAEIAQATISCFRQVVPAAVPGVVFLSGGQSSEQATRNLNAMNRMGGQPWALSFSYGRALQNRALQVWQGRPENAEATQRAFFHRARCNGAARRGEYSADMESPG